MKRWIAISTTLCLITAASCTDVSQTPRVSHDMGEEPGREPQRTGRKGDASALPGSVITRISNAGNDTLYSVSLLPPVDPHPPGEVPPLFVEKPPVMKRWVAYGLVAGVLLAITVYPLSSDEFDME